MSKSGRRYRNPHAMDAKKRKAGPIADEHRQRLEELRQQELDDELQDMWHEDDRHDEVKHNGSA